MTFDPEGDLARHIRFHADYDDGSKDCFAVPEATLLQGGVPAVLPIIAWEGLMAELSHAVTAAR